MWLRVAKIGNEDTSCLHRTGLVEHGDEVLLEPCKIRYEFWFWQCGVFERLAKLRLELVEAGKTNISGINVQGAVRTSSVGSQVPRDQYQDVHLLYSNAVQNACLTLTTARRWVARTAAWLFTSC